MGWKSFWVWVGKEHRIQYLSFLWKLESLLSSSQQTVLADLVCAAPVLPLPLVPVLHVVLGVKQGHCHRRAFRAVCERGALPASALLLEWLWGGF